MTPKTDSVAVLRECPFCGGDQVSLSEGETGDGQPWPYIECESCGATAEPDVWNRRAALSAQGEAVQGSPQWYVEELRTLADNITGRCVGICNGAALTIERLSAPGGVEDAVTEEMVAAALDAQPFKDANSGTRVWQLIASDGEGTETVMRAALIAVLAARAGKGEANV